MCLLNIHTYARMQLFVQLSPTVTKLCHIKCDHLNVQCSKCPSSTTTHAGWSTGRTLWHNRLWNVPAPHKHSCLTTINFVLQTSIRRNSPAQKNYFPLAGIAKRSRSVVMPNTHRRRDKTVASAVEHTRRQS